MSRKARQRWFSLAELADMIGIPTSLPQQERRRRVRRMFRRLEKRDGTVYLHARGARGGALHVSLRALEALLPWEPGTLAAIREDVDKVGAEMRTLNKRVNSHGARIQKLEEFRRITQEYVAKTSKLLG